MSVTLETRVWLGTKGRFNPLQKFVTGVLRLDGDRLTFRGDEGSAVETTVSASKPSFPISMSGTGLTLFAQGQKLFVWFYDPFAGRGEDGPSPEAAVSWTQGLMAARPWRKALREATRRA